MKKSLARWKRCQQQYGGRWPQAPLEPEHVNRDWAVPWSQMPRLEAAVDAHLDELRRPRKRRHGGFRKSMAESSLKSRKGHLRRMAGAIYRALGIVPETLEQITAPDLVEPGVDYILDMRDVEKSGDVSQMLRHINAIARHHVHRPTHELKELAEIRKSVTPPQGPAEKNRKLLEKFRNAALREQFVEAPARVLHKLRRKRTLVRSDLIEGMLAFLAALLTKIPMRISEAMALKFGETIHDHGSGRNRQVVIDLPPDLVKNDMPRNAKLGPRLVAFLDVYRELILKNLFSSRESIPVPVVGHGIEIGRSYEPATCGLDDATRHPNDCPPVAARRRIHLPAPESRGAMKPFAASSVIARSTRQSNTTHLFWRTMPMSLLIRRLMS